MARSTRPSTPRLSEAARHLIFPTSIASSVFPRVQRRLASVGYGFDPWQQGFGTVALGLDASGRYAATVGGVVASIPRQVGKTYTVGGLLVGLALEFPGLRAIWTSHHLRTTTATFRSMQGIVKRPKIAPLVAENDRGGMAIRTANGEQEIRFRNGSIIMFGARAQGFGRGMAAIDVEVFDEAQILSLKALEDMVPATNQAQNPHGGLIFFIGTPPRPEDDGEAFTAKRQQALAGNVDDDMVYVELSADDDADLMDRKQWAKANPSFPSRTPLESMLRMRKNIPDDGSWRREALGVWDDVSGGSRLISADQWSATGVESPPAEGVKSFGVAFSLDGLRVSVAGAMKHDGGIHVELVGAHSGSAESGVAPLADWLAERWRDTAMIAISGKAGAESLAMALRDRGVGRQVIHVASSPDYFAACGLFYDAVRDRSVTHLASEGQQALDDSVAVCDKKARGTAGAWSWEATAPDGDETPVEAVSLALWAARTSKRKPGRRQKAVVM